MSATRTALSALGPKVTVAPDKPSLTQTVADTVTSWLGRRTSRRGFLLRSGVVGTALAVDPFGYVLRPGTAYAAVCGPGASCSSGWTAFCATINKGVNACPPGSIAAGWWKMDGASLCGGSSRYIIDCNATCSRCTTGSGRAGICAPSCWSCTCTCGPSGSCDKRKVCCNGFRYGQCNTQVAQVGAVQCRVVSCTPPWKFENCSTSPATDNRTRDHNSSELPQVFNAITRRYMALGENGSVLGASVYGQVAVSGGRVQRYQNGRISTSAHGTFEVTGAVHTRYLALGAEGGKMSFPLTPTVAVEGGGTAQRFVRGRISSHPTTGTWETFGAVNDRYRALGAEGGVLGYPLIATVPAPKGGLAQRFTGGRLSWHPALGAFEVLEPVHLRYRVLGGESSPLGYPTGATGKVVGGTGLAQNFQRGRISQSAATGAWETLPPLTAAYAALGNEAGRLGFPVEATTSVAGGVGQSFQRGRLSWSPATGAHVAGGAIAAEHLREGGEAGPLGFPVTDQETDPEDGSAFVVYQGGTLRRDALTGIVTRS